MHAKTENGLKYDTNNGNATVFCRFGKFFTCHCLISKSSQFITNTEVIVTKINPFTRTPGVAGASFIDTHYADEIIVNFGKVVNSTINRHVRRPVIRTSFL
jgi:hypothetical protein